MSRTTDYLFTYQVFLANIASEKVPPNNKEALKSPKWKVAIQEMDALKKNGIWSNQVDLPKGKKTVGCRWIFNVKYNSNGSVSQYKERLVA